MVRLYVLGSTFVLVLLGLINQCRQTKKLKEFIPMLDDFTSKNNNKYDILHHQQQHKKKKRQATIKSSTSKSTAREFTKAMFTNSTVVSSPSPSLSSCPNLKPLSWEWNRYSLSNRNNETKTPPTTSKGRKKKKTKSARKRLLIGLFSGYDRYAQMLEITAPINKAYAKHYSHDVVVLQGTYLLVDEDQCHPPGRRATFNKLAILKEALKHRQTRYDQVLILDTDAMMHDMDFDVTTLLKNHDTMLVAHRVKKYDVLHTWDVNAGVTLWNLHHPNIEDVVQRWERQSRKALKRDIDTGDQSKLHEVLKSESRYIDALTEEFAYGHGTVIRHYIRRRTNKQWKDPNVLETRLELLQDAANQVCTKFASIICDDDDKEGRNLYN